MWITKVNLKMVGVAGFEPTTSWSQTTRSTKLSYTPLVGLVGFEPTTP